MATTTIIILVAVIVVALIVGVAYVGRNGIPNASTTANSVGFPGYPSTLPQLTLQEEGSSLMYIQFAAWIRNFSQGYNNKVAINIDAGGSGLGIQDIENGLTNIGASDAYLPNDTMAQYPWILNIPLAVSAQQIMYNVPGIPKSMHLNFSGPVLAGIYNGSITNWNDPALAAINRGAASLLPNHQITPIRRFDSSGDTFIFTQYLSKTDSWWNKSVGAGLVVNWPAIPSEIAISGNAGMEDDLLGYNYSIAYIGISYLGPAVSAGLPYGYLENQAGNFVNISATNIDAAVSQFASSVPNDERISMIDGPGANSYPIVNFEYALVSKNQTNPNVALDLKTFLKWAADPNYGNSYYYLHYAEFQPLPASVYQLTLNQINEIST